MIPAPKAMNHNVKDVGLVELSGRAVGGDHACGTTMSERRGALLPFGYLE